MKGAVADYFDRAIGDAPTNDYQRGHLEALKVARAELATILAVDNPVPMLLNCPKCGEQHIDEPDEANGWSNPPHRSHRCGGCGCIWRPADVATVGVAEINTRGGADTWLPSLLLDEPLDPPCDDCELPQSICDCEEAGR
jgi:hypothetical protein